VPAGIEGETTQKKPEPPKKSDSKPVITNPFAPNSKEQFEDPPAGNPDEPMIIVDDAEKAETEEDWDTEKPVPRKSRVTLSSGKLGSLLGLDRTKWAPPTTSYAPSDIGLRQKSYRPKESELFYNSAINGKLHRDGSPDRGGSNTKGSPSRDSRAIITDFSPQPKGRGTANNEGSESESGIPLDDPYAGTEYADPRAESAGKRMLKNFERS
jgi:hypothetical protein